MIITASVLSSFFFPVPLLSSLPVSSHLVLTLSYEVGTIIVSI